jgi:sugar phosphate isomerase/epimerase
MLNVCVQTGGSGYNPYDPAPGFAMLKKCGFDSVDYNTGYLLPGSAITKGPLTEFFDQDMDAILAHFAPIKAAAEENGITFSQMHAPFPLWLKEREDVNRYLIMVVEKLCRACAFLGCPAIVVHPITRTLKEDEIATNFALYRALIPVAKETGVKICLENMFIGFNGHMLEGACADVDEVCMYIDTLNAEAGADCFGYCLDVGHANLMGKKLRHFVRKLGNRLTVLHLHENNGVLDQHMAPYTQTAVTTTKSAMDWESFIQGLREIGYKGDLSFETFHATDLTPAPIRSAMLTYIAAIGRYWAERISAAE